MVSYWLPPINKEATDMSEDFGPNCITLTDEDGNEFELE